ncbi:MAG: family 78 glycoside hydrolase catalytic domain [Bacteroidales bacterium]
MRLLSTLLFSAILVPVFIFSSCKTTTDQCQAVNLKTEYLVNPIGIDAPSPRFTWHLEDTREGAAQTAYRIIIGTDSADVASGQGDFWNSAKVISDRMLVSYDGPELQPFTRYYWAVTVWDMDGNKSVNPGMASFETGMMGASGWKGQWISDTRDINRKPASYYRKDFTPASRVKEARVYIAAGGYFELYLNGEKAGDHMLDPAKTRYDRRILYVTHDVTDMLSEGDNTIGVLLGNGWFNHQSTAVWFFHEVPWRARPAFCADLRITYEDGTVEIVSSGMDWRTSPGPVIFNSIYTGEHYDARMEQEGWDSPGFDDGGWFDVIRVPAPSQNIVSQALHPVRKTLEIPAVNMVAVDNRTWVFDLGRNIAGISRLSVSGEEGTTIRLKHGERVYDNGRVDMSNIDMHYRPVDDSDPFQTDIFILSGKKEDVFMPSFNYKGFQYVEVSADRPVELTKESLTGYFMHSDVPVSGTINSSNDVLNKIWEAGNNSYLSNLFGYPTDCPQREKLGWTGDGHIAIETGLYNFDGITIYEKWIADHRDEQQPNGVLPAIIPTSGWGYHWANGVDWTSSIAIVPWNIYMFYGDSRLLEETYDNIRRYVDYIDYTYPSGLTDWGLGDWVPVRSRANVELTSTVYYFAVVSILANAAELFEKHDDYNKYYLVAEKIKNAFNSKFLDESTGIYGSGYQTELSMPLFWGIVPESFRETVAANLAARVAEDGYQIDSGLLGSKSLLNALSENGYPDIAYRVASRETFPSWGWWIVNGATTFFENWPLDATSDISMNHIMFGEISAWFYKALGGIKPDRNNPGFKNVILEPHFVEGLDHFEAIHKGPFGEIRSSWERGGDKVLYSVTIPPNSSADLFLKGNYTVSEGNPLKEENSSFEGGANDSGNNRDSLKNASDTKSERKHYNGNRLTLASGSYVFVVDSF